jgi:biotin carboxyl carrier protein
MKNLRITVEGKAYDVQVELLDEENSAAPAPRRASSGASTRMAAPAPQKASAAKAVAAPSGDGAIVSPLSAVVVSIDVAVGDAVTEGQKVVTLEAMKMNTIVSAAAAGTVKAILVSAGDGVEEGQGLVELA